MSQSKYTDLVRAARKARSFAQARYSQFKVGAALLTAGDQIISGCNIESSSYGLTICAERVALTKALSEGITDFKAIAIAAADGFFCTPCGACRQFLHDYAPLIDVVLTDGNNEKIIPLAELLPLAFDDSQLGVK